MLSELYYTLIAILNFIITRRFYLFISIANSYQCAN